jgi:2'-5' RNA ligase
MASKLTDREQYLRRVESLALSALPITALPMVASPPAHHDGVMVALVPEAPEEIAIDHPEALTADDLHITLCYLGKVQDLSNADMTAILAKARSVVDSIGHAFTATADGVVIMGSSDDGVPATALLVQSEDIVNLYDAMAESLEYKSKFPSFIPHMTTGYGVPVEMAQERVGQTITFNSVLVKFGDARHVIPLVTSIVAAPRGANVIDRVIDSMGRLWDEALHPRDGEGKFIKKNGAISGKMSVPTADRKSVNVVDANRASVVGFKTVGNDVWVLAEITRPDGSKVQGFAKANEVRAVAPVKARLDALYPVSNGDDFVDSSLERARQLDLILEAINNEFGPDNDDGAMAFLDTLGLNDTDLDYIYGGDDPDFLGGIRKIDRELTPDEIEEQEDIINDAMMIKKLRDRVHGLDEEAHVVPSQRLISGDAPDQEVIEALKGGADPFTVQTSNLLAAMDATGRFDRKVPGVSTGISKIMWLTDESDQTEHDAYLAGMKTSTTDRAFFVKESIIGAEFNNSDIVHEVVASLISDAVKGGDGGVIVPKAVFGDNPVWDGNQPADDFEAHQPGHVISQHATYLVPPDWEITDAFTETVNLRNDIKGADSQGQFEMTAAFNEDMGNLYGNGVAAMVLLDYVIMNGDRNPNNALLASSPSGQEGRVIPIDHGLAFDEPFDPKDVPSDDPAAVFNWFMKYNLTRGWLDMVQGGLELNENVTQDSLRRIVSNFADEYSDLDPADIVSQFAAIPGVTEAQIERVRTDMDGAVRRISWLVENQEAVFNSLTGGVS